MSIPLITPSVFKTLVPKKVVPPHLSDAVVTKKLCEFASSGNVKGILKIANDLRYLTPRGLIRPQIINETDFVRDDMMDYPPLIWAIYGNYPECVAALCQAGADTINTYMWTLNNYVYEWTPLMLAVSRTKEERQNIECVRALFKVGGSLWHPRNLTERNALFMRRDFEFSALTMAIHLEEGERPTAGTQQLVQLLLENRVQIREEDFYQCNLQNTEILKLLLNQLLDNIDDIIDIDISECFRRFPTAFSAWHAGRTEFNNKSPKLYDSGLVLIDYFTSDKLLKSMHLDDFSEEVIDNRHDGSEFFHNVIADRIPEMVQACIDRKLPLHHFEDVFALEINSVSWDILRKLQAYKPTLMLTATMIKKILHQNDFLFNKDVDFDILNGWYWMWDQTENGESQVDQPLCEWGNFLHGFTANYAYESKIAECRPKNLKFAIEHGFDPELNHTTLLVPVHNQSEFVKALCFMKIVPIVIDLCGLTYVLPKTDIDILESRNEMELNDTCRIINGRLTGDFTWLLENFSDFENDNPSNTLSAGDVIHFQTDGSINMLAKMPDGGWYTFTDGRKTRTKKSNVKKMSSPLKMLTIETECTFLIINAKVQEQVLNSLQYNDIDEFDFEDEFWSVQTAETLGALTFGDNLGESVLSCLLRHRWNLAVYVQGDIFTIIQQFVDRGAYIPKDFCQNLLDNASDYTVWIDQGDQDTLYDAKKIYHLLKENCDNATEPIFSKFAADYTQYIEQPRKSMAEFFIDPLYVQLEFFEYILGEEKPKDLPLTPIFIPKICQMVQEGNYEQTKKKLSDFLVHALSPESPSKDPQYIVECVKLMLAAGFDPNGVTEPYQIPLTYVLKWGNDLVLKILLDDPRLEPNKNIADNVQLTALEKILLSPTFSDQDRIMIQMMLEDDRVECPFHRHVLSADAVNNNPEIVHFLMMRKYYTGNKHATVEMDKTWFFDPNTVPLYELRHPRKCKKKLQQQGIEPDWSSPDDKYTKRMLGGGVNAGFLKVLHWRGLALQHLPWKQRNYYFYAYRAVKSNGLALQFVTTTYMMSWDIVQTAVIQNWRAFQFLPEKAYYERVQEPIPFEQRSDVQNLLIYGEKINVDIKAIIGDAAKGIEYDLHDLRQDIGDIFDDDQDLDKLAEKILTVMEKIRGECVAQKYEYKGLPSQSEHGFVIWMRESLFQEGGPHEGEWSEFEKMFPKAAAYAFGNPNTRTGWSQIELKKSNERKQLERQPIQELRKAVHTQLGEKVDIVHWDDFEPVMF